MMKLIIIASKSVPLKRQGLEVKDKRVKRKGLKGEGMEFNGKKSKDQKEVTRR